MMTPSKPAARGVTLADVAKHAGVSVSTASFVLSGRAGGKPSGSPATQKRVRAAADELGYVGNAYARAIRTGRSMSIFLAIATVGDPWGIELARAVRAKALPEGLSTLIMTDDRWFEFLSGSAPNNAFVTGVDLIPDGAAKLRQLARAGSRLVAFSEFLEPDGFDVIASLHLEAVRKAYGLLRTRHERIGFIGPRIVPVDELPDFPSRAAEFIRAALDAGDEASIASMRATGRGPENTARTARKMLEDPNRPRAVICSAGDEAIALQAAAVRLGISMPDELEIISIGGIPELSQPYAPITYYGVRNVFDRIAQIIVDRALARSPEEGTLHRFTWEIFPGETTLPGGSESAAG